MNLKNSEPEVEPKKQLLILNKYILKYGFLLGCLLVISSYSAEEDNFDKRWEELHKNIEYRQSSRYKELDKDKYYRSYPTGIDEYNAVVDNVDDYDIEYSRDVRFENGSDSGVEKHIEENEDKKIEDLATPDSELPTFNSKNKDYNSSYNTDFSSILKFLFYLIVILLLAFLVYRFILNGNLLREKKLSDEDYEFVDDINPATINKSKMEQDLEEAISKENYRLAVRIYYLMLLKNIIEKGWIKWAKKKTNYHYLLEMADKNEYQNFDKAVNMYEWTWYGKNHPQKDTFIRFSEFYNHFLNRLDDE